jgi:hypothetical protein
MALRLGQGKQVNDKVFNEQCGKNDDTDTCDSAPGYLHPGNVSAGVPQLESEAEAHQYRRKDAENY